MARIQEKSARKSIILLSTVLFILGLLIALLGVNLLIKNGASHEKVYVGVDVGYDDENAVYKLVDAVKGYVNLIILGSLNVTTDTAKLTRVCDYLYQNGLHFIVFMAYGPVVPQGPDKQFIQTAQEKWGDKFLGAYVFDEVGKQIDLSHEPAPEAENYSDAAQKFVINVDDALTNVTNYYETPMRLFTSDYALYWYDYLIGYDVVFGEFVGNQSQQLAIALCRGAAETQNKDWGTMITWKYQQPPFLEDPEQLYTDMVLAYQNGAKYIVVFNSPANFTATTEYGTLTTQHLDTLKRFWNYMNTHTAEAGSARTAYVLPRDYGYGFRGTDDKIWGLFGPDTLSPVVWNQAKSLITTYGTGLDIVYETQIGNLSIALSYDKLIFWNGTTTEK